MYMRPSTVSRDHRNKNFTPPKSIFNQRKLWWCPIGWPNSLHSKRWDVGQGRWKYHYFHFLCAVTLKRFTAYPESIRWRCSQRSESGSKRVFAIDVWFQPRLHLVLHISAVYLACSSAYHLFWIGAVLGFGEKTTNSFLWLGHFEITAAICVSRLLLDLCWRFPTDRHHVA